MMELRSPVRLYWDLAPVPMADSPHLSAIAKEIIAARFLAVDLRLVAPGSVASAAPLVRQLAAAGMGVTLTVETAALAHPAEDLPI